MQVRVSEYRRFKSVVPQSALLNLAGIQSYSLSRPYRASTQYHAQDSGDQTEGQLIESCQNDPAPRKLHQMQGPVRAAETAKAPELAQSYPLNGLPKRIVRPLSVSQGQNSLYGGYIGVT